MLPLAPTALHPRGNYRAPMLSFMICRHLVRSVLFNTFEVNKSLQETSSQVQKNFKQTQIPMTVMGRKAESPNSDRFPTDSIHCCQVEVQNLTPRLYNHVKIK